AAIVRPIVNPREHDERMRRLHAEGQGQQQRDGGQRADPRQNADEGAQRDADKAIPHRLPREGDGEAQRKIRGKIAHGRHRMTSTFRERPYLKIATETAGTAMEIASFCQMEVLESASELMNTP